MNQTTLFKRSIIAAAVAAFSVSTAVAHADPEDFGVRVEQQLKAKAEKLFGVEQPLDASAPATTGAYRSAAQTAAEQVLLAKGLKAEYVTRGSAQNGDMMLLWPNGEHPTHIITAVEEFSPHVIGKLASGSDKLTPSVQRIDLVTGKSEIMLRGMAGADGIRMTAWGTILVPEENSSGNAYEIIDPLHVTNHTVTNRALGTIVDADGKPSNSVVKRSALPTMAWEGMGVLASGVVIAGDELRPGSPANADGGAIFKFVPSVVYNPANGPITDLAQSPLVAGNVYALQSSCVNNTQQFGQGCEIGMGAWIAVNAASARAEANSKGATGFYRPEDLELDPLYSDAANPQAVRFCWTNTGNEDANNYGEVVCGIDNEPLVTTYTDSSGAIKPKRTTAINRFVEGDADLNQPDNFAFQPVTGNHYVIEDHPNGDIWACLPDGADRDIKTDGCVKILSVKDSSAEPTGFFFAPDGKTAYVNIQHSDDSNMSLVDDYGTDDLIKITGFKVNKERD
jgi:hypothetical protein